MMNDKTNVVVKLITMVLMVGIAITCAILGEWWVAAVAVASILLGVLRISSLMRKIRNG